MMTQILVCTSIFPVYRCSNETPGKKNIHEGKCKTATSVCVKLAFSLLRKHTDKYLSFLSLHLTRPQFTRTIPSREVGKQASTRILDQPKVIAWDILDRCETSLQMTVSSGTDGQEFRVPPKRTVQW